jgi:hypothetical protein
MMICLRIIVPEIARMVENYGIRIRYELLDPFANFETAWKNCLLFIQICDQMVVLFCLVRISLFILIINYKVALCYNISIVMNQSSNIFFIYC